MRNSTFKRSVIFFQSILPQYSNYRQKTLQNKLTHFERQLAIDLNDPTNIAMASGLYLISIINMLDKNMHMMKMIDSIFSILNKIMFIKKIPCREFQVLLV